MAQNTIIPVVVEMTVAESVQAYSFEVAQEALAFELDIGTSIQVVSGQHYEGPTEVIPTEETQTLQTQGLFMDQDITVAPIPSNYGRITWNGSVLTVS